MAEGINNRVDEEGDEEGEFIDEHDIIEEIHIDDEDLPDADDDGDESDDNGDAVDNGDEDETDDSVHLFTGHTARDGSDRSKRQRLAQDGTSSAGAKQKSVTPRAMAPSPPPSVGVRPKTHTSSRLTSQSKRDAATAAREKGASASHSRSADARADTVLEAQPLDGAFCPMFHTRGSSSRVVQQDDSGLTDEAVAAALVKGIVLNADRDMLAMRTASEAQDACFGSVYKVVAHMIDMANRERSARLLQKEAERKLGIVQDDLKLSSQKICELKSQLKAKDEALALQVQQAADAMSVKMDELKMVEADCQYNADSAAGWADFGKRTDGFVTYLMEQQMMPCVPEDEREALRANLTEKAKAEALQLSYFGLWPESPRPGTPPTEPTSPTPEEE